MTSPEQKRVFSRMAAAAVLLAAVAAACGVTGWRPWRGSIGEERLLYGLACALPVAVCLAVAIARVASHRFFTPADIAGGGLTAGTDEVRVLNAVLQNTLEQAALAIPTYAAAALFLPDRWLGAVAGASALFVIGRIAFARGYSGGAADRAFGFAMCFYGTIGLLVATLAMVLSN